MKQSIVARGIDSLVIGYKMSGEIPESYTEIWNIAKDMAKAPWANGSFPIWIGSGRNYIDIEILPSGKQRYEWIMQNDDIQIHVAREFKEGTAEDFAAGKVTPEIMVTYRSSYLWRDGIERCTSRVRTILSELGTVVAEKISRVDLCCDISEKLPELALTSGQIQGRMRSKSNYVASAKATGMTNTGYQMGKGDLVIRAYNKLHELKKSKKDWFEPIWKKGGWNGESDITRLECQFRRGILKGFGIESVKDLILTMPDLWHYATYKWMVIRDQKGTDSHRHRWTISEFWEIVQSCVFMFGDRIGVTRAKQIVPKYQHLKSMVNGCAKSMVAYLTSSGLTMDKAKLIVSEDYQLIFDDESFNMTCQERQAKYAIL